MCKSSPKTFALCQQTSSLLQKSRTTFLPSPIRSSTSNISTLKSLTPKVPFTPLLVSLAYSLLPILPKDTQPPDTLALWMWPTFKISTEPNFSNFYKWLSTTITGYTAGSLVLLLHTCCYQIGFHWFTKRTVSKNTYPCSYWQHRHDIPHQQQATQAPPLPPKTRYVTK